MTKGWFAIPGVQDGDRSIAEQLRGLDPMLAECKGKRVLDLGCAEGMIARAVADAGAASVVGLEYNSELLAIGQRLHAGAPNLVLAWADCNEAPAPTVAHGGAFDIVLALALFHKLVRPDASVRRWARLAGSLLVVRLPVRSVGEFASKFSPFHRVNLLRVLPQEGFTLERTEAGPRKELVQYWRRNG